MTCYPLGRAASGHSRSVAALESQLEVIVL